MDSLIDNRNILVINPLGAGLEHYTKSVNHLLTDLGISFSVSASTEPSASGRGQTAWVLDYLRLLWRAHREAPAIVLITWPVIGYWDFIVSRLLLSRSQAIIVVHDPRPLVRAKGYGRLPRLMASIPGARPSAVVHGQQSAELVKRDVSLSSVAVIPLPMLPPQLPQRNGSNDTVIRVLGMYKADRAIESLEKIAAQGPAHWRYEIIGRGWPAVAGWEVDDRFVADAEFDRLIATSSVVLIAYRRFFQSDVAIRCLELCTPIVGPAESSLRPLLGNNIEWLVDDDAWLPAIEAAISATSQDIYIIATDAYMNIKAEWQRWLSNLLQQR